jgi:hypothetical protein
MASSDPLRSEMVFFWWTIVTFLVSVVGFSYLCLISFGVGFESAGFDRLWVLSLVRTVGLLIGAIFSLSRRASIPLLVLLSSLLLPLGFLVLTRREVRPAPETWVAVPISLFEILLSSFRIKHLRNA